VIHGQREHDGHQPVRRDLEPADVAAPVARWIDADPVPAHPDRPDRPAPTVPAGHVGTPTEIADTVVWAPSEEASHLVGPAIEGGGRR
jgi:NAD(P)-dependent dehydrogenase (short-subunit alcohol dehydrogenase family)